MSARNRCFALALVCSLAACNAGTEPDAAATGDDDSAHVATPMEAQRASPQLEEAPEPEEEAEEAAPRVANAPGDVRNAPAAAPSPEAVAQGFGTVGLEARGGGGAMVGGGSAGVARGGLGGGRARATGAMVAGERRSRAFQASAGRPAAPPARPTEPMADRERYEDYGENDWVRTADDALATFSVDVDTASYALTRSTLNRAQRPAPASIRVEEFVNAFDYGYAPPVDTDVPFSVHTEVAPSRFGEGLEMLRVGIQGYETHPDDRAPANLVFLVDVSGSMRGPDRLGLVKYSLSTLLSALGPDDTLSIVTYAGRAATLLEPTRVEDRGAILQAIEGLSAGGGTNGAEGIETAYRLARQNAVDGGVNRVIWCSDGDLNVGITGDRLLSFIEEMGRRGVALTTLGFGRGNYNDRDLERFANRGDGNYHFIDDRNEALRVLSDTLGGTLQTIARDVKIQVDINPELVESYRLIGYENRDIADADFRNDAVDAGEIGSGHSVTALLEFERVDGAVASAGDVLATVRVRYELPGEEGEGREVAHDVVAGQAQARFEDASASFRLAAATAEFAEILRGGENTSGDAYDAVEGVLRGAQAQGDLQVEELAALVTQARALAN